MPTKYKNISGSKVLLGRFSIKPEAYVPSVELTKGEKDGLESLIKKGFIVEDKPKSTPKPKVKEPEPEPKPEVKEPEPEPEVKETESAPKKTKKKKTKKTEEQF